MIGLLKSLFGGGIGAAAQGVSRAVATFAGDKVQRESNVHDEQRAAMDQMAAEFQYRGSRTWFDSLIDGVNRLPRPVIAFGCIGLFVWCIADPAEFTIAMMALGAMPEWLAIVIGQVILLYMGGRMLNDWKMGRAAAPTRCARSSPCRRRFGRSATRRRRSRMRRRSTNGTMPPRSPILRRR